MSHQSEFNYTNTVHKMHTILLVLTVIVLSNCRKSDAKLLANNIKIAKRLSVLNGTTAEITCQASLEEFALIRASKQKIEITWRWKPQNDSKWLNDLPPEINTSLNTLDESSTDLNGTSTILLATLNISKATISDSGMFGCFQKNSSTPIDSTAIYVGLPPEKPENLFCKTNGMLEAMTCCWSMGKPTYLETTYHLVYNILPSISSTTPSGIEDSLLHYELLCHKSNMEEELNEKDTNRKVCCSVELLEWENIVNFNETSPMYFLHGLVTNALNSSKTDELSDRPELVVKTDPPQEVFLSNHIDNETHSLTTLLIEWKPPKVNSMLKNELIYSVRYRISNGNDSWNEENDIRKTFLLVTNLLSNTLYDVQVSTRPDGVTIFFGFLSEWTETQSLMTSQSAPTTSFKFLKIVATVNPSTTLVEISLHWLMYGNFNDPEFFYEIEIYVGNDSVHKIRLGHYETKAKIKVPKPAGELPLGITGKYCNVKGCSASSLSKIYPTEALEPIDNVKLSFSSTKLQITWETKDNNTASECILRVCPYSRPANHFYSVFYNKSEFERTNTNASVLDFPCDDDVGMNYIVACASGKFITNNSKISPCYQYSAFVLKSTMTSISIIHSSSIHSNVALYTPSFDNAIDLRVQADTDEMYHQMRINWNQDYLCNTSYDAGMILTVLYSPTFDINSNNFESQKKTFYSQIGRCSRRKQVLSHNISRHLIDSTEYEFGLAFCCPASPTSASLCFPSSGTAKVSTLVKNSAISPEEVHHYIGSIVGTVIGIIAIVVFLTLVCHYHRKEIKNFLRTALWPSVSSPVVLIRLQGEQDTRDDAVIFKSLRNDVLDHECNRNQNNHSNNFYDVHETCECIDSIQNVPHLSTVDDFQMHQLSHQQILQTIKSDYSTEFNEKQLLLVSDIPKEDKLSRDSVTDSIESPCYLSDNIPYSMVSPLLSVLTDHETAYDCAPSPPVTECNFAQERELTKESETPSTSRLLQRPHSYSANSERSFNDMGSYVLYYENKRVNRAKEKPIISLKRANSLEPIPKQSPENFQVTYSKIALDAEGAPVFVSTPVPSCNDTVGEQNACAACYSGNDRLVTAPNSQCECAPILQNVPTSRKSFPEEVLGHVDPQDRSGIADYIESSSYITVPGNLPIYSGDNVFDSNRNIPTETVQSFPVMKETRLNSSTDSIDELYPSVRINHATTSQQDQISLVNSSEDINNNTRTVQDGKGPSLALNRSSSEECDDYLTVGEALNLGRSDRGIPAQNVSFLDDFNWRPEDTMPPRWDLHDPENSFLPSFSRTNPGVLDLLLPQTSGHICDDLSSDKDDTYTDENDYVTTAEACFIPK